MTVEEMAREVERYCDSRVLCGKDDFYPDDCPLYKFVGDCFDDDVIERNYKLLVKEGLIVPKGSNDKKANDNVNHPSHYNNGGMECIDEMVLIFGKEATMHFCLCNAWKYRYRANAKNGQEDLDKAHWYIAKYKKLKEELINE